MLLFLTVSEDFLIFLLLYLQVTEDSHNTRHANPQLPRLLLTLPIWIPGLHTQPVFDLGAFSPGSESHCFVLSF